jgi:two-component system sensor histidine kinase UhpB
MHLLAAARGRFSSLPLFWQIFLPNVAVIVVVTAVLALAPTSVPATGSQAVELIAAIAVIVLVNLVLIRRATAPVARLTELMARVDPLEPGQRAPSDGGSAEVTRLGSVFNEMLDRLETERRDSGAKMLSAQERERVRLARELHDEIGQSVTGLMLELDRVADRAPLGLEAEVREAQEVARAISDEVREIVRRLRPEALDDLGLVSAIVALTERFAAQTSTSVVRRIDREMPALSADAELVVYRVAQESLTNVARHAEASEVVLDLGLLRGDVVLEVSDDGVGTAGSEPRSGILGMRERAMLIGARLEIGAGRAGSGTRVVLRTPVGTGESR